ncbi:unnamed protein product, partial [Didymodactylos carnosus]
MNASTTKHITATVSFRSLPTSTIMNVPISTMEHVTSTVPFRSLSTSTRMGISISTNSVPIYSMNNTKSTVTLLTSTTTYALRTYAALEILTQRESSYRHILNSTTIFELKQPKFSDNLADFQIPYFYSLWKDSPSLLPRALSPGEHDTTMSLIDVFQRLCNEHHITFMMSDGTLLGSWRHHDIIPYDDDVDFLVQYSNRERLFQILNESATAEGINVAFALSKVLKITFNNTGKARHVTWNWPFIDIWFYRENSTHIWYNNMEYYTIEKTLIFPLVLRPLAAKWLPSPRRPYGYFKSMIKDKSKEGDFENYCKNEGYNHRKELLYPTTGAECKKLKPYYPFVERSCSKVLCTEW